MSTPSMLLLCAGAVASLGGVWSLAGLSESAPMRSSPRVVLAVAAGLLGEGLLFVRAPSELRGDLSLPLLFGSACLLSLAVGAAKIEAALSNNDGPRVVRRSAGIVIGAVLGMAAVGAASLDLSSSSLLHARLGWAFMFALLASVLIVFSGRARYAGAGLMALGQRALLLSLVAAALLGGAQLTVAAPAPLTPEANTLTTTLREAVVDAPSAGAPPVASDNVAPSEAPNAAPSASVPTAIASTAPSPSGAPSPSAVPAAADNAAAPGSIEIGEITARGLLEADARGGVMRRLDRLEACLTEPKNAQHGSLDLKIGIDPSGSVAYIRLTSGELKDTPLSVCLLRGFYKMGFAAPASNTAYFTVSLRVP